jgi:hypothetical protein
MCMRVSCFGSLNVIKINILTLLLNFDTRMHLYVISLYTFDWLCSTKACKNIKISNNEKVAASLEKRFHNKCNVFSNY